MHGSREISFVPSLHRVSTDTLIIIVCNIKDGDTALMEAAWEGHTNVVVKLVEAGAYLDQKNKVCDA